MKVPWGKGELRQALVYGLGLSGRAAARFLLDRGVAVTAVDARPRAALDLGDLAEGPQLSVLAGREPEEMPAGAAGDFDAVVVSPGVPMTRPLLVDARRRGLPVIAEVELAFPFLHGTVVAITGSNGKSTTTALTGAMLAAAGRAVEVCGNIGEPLSGKVDGPAGRVFVVEMSSFQIEGIVTFAPHAAALLNLAEDHLDRYPSFGQYAAAKRALFRNLGPEGIAVLNADDAETLAVETRARRRLFSRLRPVEDGCALDGDRVIEVQPGASPVELFATGDLPIAGVHNLENAMAAALLARAAGADASAIRQGLRGFTGLPHRLQKVGEAGGVTWYDDSKGTNPAATLKSLEGFADKTVHLILGGRNKGADLVSLMPLVHRKAIRLYLIGEAADDFERALSGAAPCEMVDTLDRAVAEAAARARPGEVVLLSPACASFDQFRNFSHRGEVFTQLVHDRIGRAHGQETGL
ncbi:MAG TPA: UDP-N-acetylmuramoyl-L-alanine--D-glutamate ligase [Thermoanaerobaculia bacterium]|nr:UDP-N-acetylmuramoyl-L-alanine--D-glutamate ligase [Thermoanaerobaculia bacterium]